MWRHAAICIRFTDSLKVSMQPCLVLLLIACFAYSNSYSQVAPVSPPTGGFAIDGDVRANTPTANQGDWFAGAGGSGGAVFNETPPSTITPIDPLRTGKAVDPYTSDDNVFTNGSKFNDYIGDLRWFNNSAPDKNDINNALYHVARNQSNQDQWIFISGDRLSTNGTSYIDFELLQGTVTENANGTFTGTPDATKANGGGRTLNDICITMEYTNGGTKPFVYIYQWKQSGGKWSFQQVTPSVGLANNAFAETNRFAAINNLPYQSFGSSSYQQYAFVEAGINISYLLNLTGLACSGLNVQTLWVKTKASASSTAALKDYMSPIPVSFTFGNSAIDPLGPFCVSNTTPQELTATPSGGSFTGTGVTKVGNQHFFTPSSAGVGEHTISYSASGCNATLKIKVNALPTITPGSYGPLCIDATAINLGGSPSGGIWSGTGVTLVGGVYKFNPATAGAGSHTLTYSFTDANSCSNSGTTNITVNNKPTVTSGSYGPLCVDAAAITLGGTPSGGTWSGTGVSLVGGVYKFTAFTAGVGSHNLTYSYTDGNSCSNSAATSITVNGKPTVTPGNYGPYCIDAAAVTLSGTPSGGTWSGTGVSLVGGVYKFTPSTAGTGTHTLTYSYTDGNSCNNSATTNVTVNSKPTVTPGSYGPVCIDGGAITLMGSPAGGNWSGTGVSLVSGAYQFSPSTAGAGTFTLTYNYADGNTCSNSGTTDITVNALPATPMVNVTAPTCQNPNGTVTVTSPLGAQYEYSNGGAYQPGTSFSVASGAGYSITVRNTNTQCVAAATTGTMPVQPASPTFTVCIVQPTLCSKGSLTINASGGTGFSYSIDGVDFSNTTGVFSNLGAASVTTVQVKNSDGCASPATSCADLVENCSPLTTLSQRAPSTLMDQEVQTTVKAFPNPFSDRVKFVVNAPKSGNGVLEVYNNLGQKIKTVFQGKVHAGANNFELQLPGQSHANLIYRFVMDNKQITGKLMQISK